MNYREQLKQKNYLEGWQDAKTNNTRELNGRSIRRNKAKYQYEICLESKKSDIPF